MARQVFNGDIEQVQIAKDIHNHLYPDEGEPPDDPDVSIQCPQCRRLTWRYSQFCRLCRLDLFAWQQGVAQELQLAREREARLKRNRIGLTVVGLGLGVIAIGLVVGNEHTGSLALAGMAIAAIGLSWIK